MPSDIQPILRSDYQVPTHWIDHVALEFDLAPRRTLVTAELTVRQNDENIADVLELVGEKLDLQSISIDSVELTANQYELSGGLLRIFNPPSQFTLVTKVLIDPADNKSLYGLYQSSGNFCTQCEAMGFRRITYFLDRPDVLARYRVTLRADKAQYPVLLSNGNRVGELDLADGRHEVVWEDPFPKPSYLFALVGGDLRCHRGTFTTASGREVQLEIWVEPENIDFCEHALRSLQKSMAWDEQTFGLEYDLDIYMIVAVNDFNMGAMENKGLNIFNSKYVLASPETATDDDYLNVERVIAHEYFHNWTGNRVTCRDWFQLTLKEGLTVFRDQQFTADQTSAAVKRIDDVASLRSRQFPEDAGPMAHPIRPESYVSMDNFYTTTVYEKGAEIIRIYHTILGADGFRRGMDLYFERHDGDAVTCDDFRNAMADANHVDLKRLDRWYSQPGTPILDVSTNWSEDAGLLTLSCRQSYPALPEDIPGAAGRQPVPIPINVGLVDNDGNAIVPQVADPEHVVRTAGETVVLLLDEAASEFTFSGLEQRPTVSVLRNFSAPVHLRMQRTAEELAFLMANDHDPFNRWNAGQTLATQVLVEITRQIEAGQPIEWPEFFVAAIEAVLAESSGDNAFRALLLTLPTERVLSGEIEQCNPDSLHEARQFVRRQIAVRYQSQWLELYHSLAAADGYSLTQQAINDRRLKNVVLGYLATLESPESRQLSVDQFNSADNMTDSQAALRVLVDIGGAACDEALQAFSQRWKHNPLVLDKWFGLQAVSRREDTLDRVVQLTSHADFQLTNPNRVRSLLGSFSQNQVRFHASDGRGYALIADFVLKIDSDNPQLAARLVSTLNDYRQFDKTRQAAARTELERIHQRSDLSKDVREIVERALKF